ncbi:MAG: mechanosensitive ion channel protein MscS [Gammaproteobacteria bacterium]|nr:mechanosensitive ion channel protein MscS [Gammaproteobacteria bacterium]
MKTFIRNIGSVATLLSLSMPVFAGGSAQHFSDSLDHSAQALGHVTVAGLKLVSGAVAIPLMMSGEIGKASGEIGESLWEEANAPLPITEEVITVGPTPADAMAKEEQE